MVVKDEQFGKSVDELERAKSLIAGGVKRMNLLDEPGEFPIYFERAKGPYVWDVDGNRYVDFISSKGAILHGYADDAVNASVIEQMHHSNIMPLNHPMQNRLAELLMQVIPSAERVRLFRTGSCATSAAVRLARTFTKRDVILTSGYHGWHDWAQAGRNGVPHFNEDLVCNFRYDLAYLEQLLHEHKGRVAAVFVTPEPCFFHKEYYEECKRLTHEHGALFLLDEVKSGFRTALGGVQEKYGIKADLSTFSKAMSNGYPISAVVGREEIMDVESLTHLSGTFDVEVGAMAAAITTITEAMNRDVYTKIHEQGRAFAAGLDRLFEQYRVNAKCFDENPAAFHIVFQDMEIGKQFFRECAKRNVLFYVFESVNMNASHTDEVIADTLVICEEVICLLSTQHPVSVYEGISEQDLIQYMRFKRYI